MNHKFLLCSFFNKIDNTLYLLYIITNIFKSKLFNFLKLEMDMIETRKNLFSSLI